MTALTMVCLGTAAGCGLAALQVNPRRGLGLVSFGITGLLLADVWAALSNVDGVAPAVPSFLLGLTGGLINTPLRSVYLGAVPADARGNAMSVMNTAIYLLTSAVAALMFGLIQANILPTPEHQLWFLVVVVALCAAVAWRVLFAQTFELVIEWILWPMYRIQAHGPGARRIPMRGPLLVIANHSAYADPFWIAKIVPRHLTPMMTSYFYDVPVIRWLMVHVVRAIRVQDATFRREAPELQEAIEVLRRGDCVLLFPEAILRRKEEPMLRQFGRGVWHILRAVPQTPVVVCWIEGGWGSYTSYKNGPPMTHKGLDWRRKIDIAVTEPQVLEPSLLLDQRGTRRYLMRVCREARRFLGLPVPSDSAESADPVEVEEEPKVG
jgi:1-acyl-sn-glycerol-3-phosphate acyltransferase